MPQPSWEERLLELEKGQIDHIPVPQTYLITSATENLYKREELLWKEFQAAIKKDIVPTVPSLKTFFEWYVHDRKGRIGDRPSMNTCLWRVGRFAFMYRKFYGVQIPKVDQDSIRSVCSLTLYC